MDRQLHLQSTSVTSHTVHEMDTHLSQPETGSGYQRYVPHHIRQREQQHPRQQQHHLMHQTGPVPFGIYAPIRDQAPTLSPVAGSLPQQPPSTPSPLRMSTPNRYVVEEDTTTVKVPMLRPKPGLLKVIHLSGGVGETFTMGEVINHVKEYIRERTLYDEQDPRVVHCGGDLLGAALGVDTFTVHDALALFHKNCTMEPDSYIRIHRHLVTRTVNPQQQTSTGGGTTSYTAAAQSTRAGDTTAAPSFTPVQLTPVTKTTINTGSPQTTGASRTHTTSAQNISQSSQGISSSSASIPSSLPSSSSSSVIKFKAAQSFVTVTDSDLDRSHGEQIASSSESSSDEEGRSRFRGRRRRRGIDKPDDQTRMRSTSINVTYDEPDGVTGPWTCEVMMETSAGELTNPENDAVVVEYDSDAFSVEYEVESDSETDVQRKMPTGSTHAESDESSSTSKTAILVVCKESDVEYLADYSDSDNGSNAEFSDADKWECEHCMKRNPPFQRNCAGCWSVRPDWLPSTSKETGAKNDMSAFSDSDKLDSLQSQSQDSLQSQSQDSLQSQSQDSLKPLSQERVHSQSQDNSKESFQSNQEPNCGRNSYNKSPVLVGKIANTVHKRRKGSSSLSTSDSQDGLIKKTTDKILESIGVSLSGESKGIEKNKLAGTLTGKDDPCVVCLTRRKTASIIHGKTGHQVCCYRCAKRLKGQRKACPICRRPIQKVIRNYHL